MKPDRQRRVGDTVAIPGDYQHRALTEGPAVQRFWHLAKQLAIARLLPPARGDHVLDIGCGSGVISDFLARAGADVLAVDGSGEAIAFARERFGAPNLEFRQGLVDESFTVERPVDKVYCLELIEHIYRPQARALLDHARAVMRPGARIFLTTPNYRSAWPVIEWAMDRARLAPELGGAQHVEHYHPAKLRALCEESGFAVETMATKCGAAPWVAPLSWKLAERLQQAELGSRLPLGSVLVVVARAGERGGSR